MRNRTAQPNKPQDRPTSILAVDFGNTMTRALLIDLVEGVYALVAEAQTLTTAGFPVNDVSAGLARVVRDLGAATGRKLIDGDGKILTPEQPDRSGVDVFLATASIGRPLRTILMGLVPEISIASGKRASAGTYIDIVDTYTLDDSRSPQEQLNAMLRVNPDLFFIVGGTEDGALDPVIELATRAQLAVRLLPLAARPVILYAGNSAAHDAIARLFNGLTAVLFADNVRPTLDDESLSGAQIQLAQAFDAVAGSRGVGFEIVGHMARLGVLPNAQSYALIVNFLGQAQPGKNFAAFDVGSATSTMSAVVNGHLATSIRTDIGLGQSARSLLDTAGTDAVRRWLPFNATDNEIRAYALNKTLRPGAIPEGLRSLYVEHALLRTAIAALVAAARPAWTPTQAIDDPNAPMPEFERIIAAGGGLTGTGRPGMSAMLMLDALQPLGTARLALDTSALLPALGALARVNPEAAVQLLDAQGLYELGTAISLTGHPRPGQTAATVRIVLPNGVSETHKVEAGSLWVYPLGIGLTARVTITAGRGMTIAGQRRLRLEVSGGAAGLIVDARGRPLVLEDEVRARANQLSTWYAQATGDPVRAIDEDWLRAEIMQDTISGQRTPDDDEGAAKRRKRTKAEQPAAKPKGRGRRGRGAQEDLPQPSAEDLITDALDEAEALEQARTGRPARRPDAKKGDDIDDLRSIFS